MSLSWGRSPDEDGLVADWARGTAQVYKRATGKSQPTWKWDIFEGGKIVAKGWAHTQRTAKSYAETRCNALTAGERQK